MEAGVTKKSAREIYALAVCFCAVGVLAIQVASAAWDVIALSKPELTVSRYEYEFHQTDQAFAEHQRRLDKNQDPMTPEEVKAKRLESYATVLAAERHQHLQELIRSMLGITVAVVVFVIHWVLAKRVRGSAPVA
jgi:hypothetical protein